MAVITPQSLWTLEAYAKQRPSFRKRVIEHKALRSVPLGRHVKVQFEDELTIRYQIQEMLRIEKTFDESGISDELDCYAPLLPSGRQLKATMMIEYPDRDERKTKLAEFKGIEHTVWIQVEGADRVYSIADEDLERGNDQKTSAVHFLRFPLTPDMVAAMKYGVSVTMGIDHPCYRISRSEVPNATRASLAEDLTNN